MGFHQLRVQMQTAFLSVRASPDFIDSGSPASTPASNVRANIQHHLYCLCNFCELTDKHSITHLRLVHDGLTLVKPQY